MMLKIDTQQISVRDVWVNCRFNSLHNRRIHVLYHAASAARLTPLAVSVNECLQNFFTSQKTPSSGFSIQSLLHLTAFTGR